MGGKSTYLRQTALLCRDGAGRIVRAGARSAKLPLVDRIFARVGASDNIARGQSTFMVEMQETANILHTATSRSLVVLDEIGRGTATFDGLSIAWAVAEHLATNPRARPKTLFATHYHELTDLADATARRRQLPRRRPRVEGRHRLPAEDRARALGSQLRHPGGAARRPAAGRHRPRARDPARRSSATSLSRGGRPSVSGTPTEPQQQLGLFQAGRRQTTRSGVRLRELDVDQLTPLEALTLLAELKNEAD